MTGAADPAVRGVPAATAGGPPLRSGRQAGRERHQAVVRAAVVAAVHEHALAPSVTRPPRHEAPRGQRDDRTSTRPTTTVPTRPVPSLDDAGRKETPSPPRS